MGFKLQLEKNFVKHYRKLTAVERGMVDDNCASSLETRGIRLSGRSASRGPVSLR